MESTTTNTGEKSAANNVQELIRSVGSLTAQVKSWQDKQEKTYSSTLEALKSRMDEIGSELDSVSSRMNIYSEPLESTPKSSFEVAEIPVLEHLGLRVAHLERWVAKLDEKFKKDASIARKQFLISLVTLVAAALFFGAAVWFSLGS